MSNCSDTRIQVSIVTEDTQHAKEVVSTEENEPPVLSAEKTVAHPDIELEEQPVAVAIEEVVLNEGAQPETPPLHCTSPTCDRSEKFEADFHTTDIPMIDITMTDILLGEVEQPEELHEVQPVTVETEQIEAGVPMTDVPATDVPATEDKTAIFTPNPDMARAADQLHGHLCAIMVAGLKELGHGRMLPKYDGRSEERRVGKEC